jgi:tetratricopeptide (TPR) repeat protein
MRTGRNAEALAFARQAVAGSGGCTPAHAMLATILLSLGRPEEAEEVVTQALGLGGGSGDALDGLAHVSMRLGRHEQANALYRRATDAAPTEPRFWYNLASSERSLGRLDAAEAACNRAIGLDPTQYPSYLLRSELRLQTPEANHLDELRHRLSLAPEKDPARMISANTMRRSDGTPRRRRPGDSGWRTTSLSMSKSWPPSRPLFQKSGLSCFPGETTPRRSSSSSACPDPAPRCWSA